MSKSLELPIYIIHWKELRDRRAYLEKRLAGLDVHWVDQFDRNTLTQETIESVYPGTPDLWNQRCEGLYLEAPQPRKLSLGEVCNSLSHLSSLRSIAEGQSPGIVLEDDVVFPSFFFRGAIKKRLAATPDDFDIVFFGSAFTPELLASREPAPLPLEKVSRGVYRKKSHPATRTVDAYLVSPRFARVLVDTIKQISLPFDFELNFFLKALSARVYWWEPGVAAQGSQTGNYSSSLRS